MAIALCAAPLIIYAPNLIVDETWAAYRTLVALGALVLVFILVAARELSRFVIASVTDTVTRRRLDGAVSVAAVASIVTVAIVIALTTYHDLIQPQIDELAEVRVALRATYSEMPDTIAIRQLPEPPSPPALRRVPHPVTGQGMGTGGFRAGGLPCRRP